MKRKPLNPLRLEDEKRNSTINLCDDYLFFSNLLVKGSTIAPEIKINTNNGKPFENPVK
jgi:hypothetical protein